MKKILLILIFIIFTLILFLSFDKNKTQRLNIKKNEITPKATTQKKENIKKRKTKPKIDNTKKLTGKKKDKIINKDLPKLDLELKENKIQFYKNQKYDTVNTFRQKRKKKEKDFDFDGSVDINKSKKEIDGFNINIQKKF